MNRRTALIAVAIVAAVAVAGALALLKPWEQPHPADVTQLESRLPAGLTGCQTTGAQQPILATTRCPVEGDGAVDMSLYPDAPQVESTYERLLADHGVTPRHGNCAQPDTWPSEGSYFPASGEVRGRLACLEVDGVPTILWTDHELNIIGRFSLAGADRASLWSTWASDIRPR